MVRRLTEVKLLMGLTALALSGCLAEPKTKTCAEFPVDTDRDACGDPCQIYCAALVAACPDSINGADKITVCRGNCLEINASGAFGDTEGDTLQCRITAAVAAKSDPTQCDNASSGGGDACSDNGCDEYCSAMAANCPAAFNNLEGCIKTCEVFPTGGSPERGNSLECRASAARRASNDPAACEEASAASTDRCGSPCDGYCDQVMANCTGDQQLYADLGECMDTCELMDDDGQFDDFVDNTDSVQCRTYHASAPAEQDPVTHCPHASLYNDTNCGTTCGTYCNFCAGAFDDDAQCLRECETVTSAGGALFPDPGALRQCVPE